MKQIIFKGQYGWYISAKNYKDATDTAYINIHFAKCQEPQTNEDKMWIIIEEGAFNCYKGKVGLTIFKYEKTISPKEAMEQKRAYDEFVKDNNIKVDTDDLPFI